MVAAPCRSGRRWCGGSSWRGNFLVQLEDNFGAHAWPNHHIKLQDGEESGDGAVVGDVVTVDHIACSVDDGADVCCEFCKPDSKGG